MLKRGFTLAELIVVLLAGLILAGAAVSFIQRSGVQSVESQHIGDPPRVQDVYPSCRVEVVVYDGCDYILWGNVHSTLTHKGNCRACLARTSVHMPAEKPQTEE